MHTGPLQFLKADHWCNREDQKSVYLHADAARLFINYTKLLQSHDHILLMKEMRQSSLRVLIVGCGLSHLLDCCPCGQIIEGTLKKMPPFTFMHQERPTQISGDIIVISYCKRVLPEQSQAPGLGHLVERAIKCEVKQPSH